MASRVKLVAKSRKANKILTYDMKRDPYAYVTDRKDNGIYSTLIVECNSGFTPKMTLTGRLMMSKDRWRVSWKRQRKSMDLHQHNQLLSTALTMLSM